MPQDTEEVQASKVGEMITWEAPRSGPAKKEARVTGKKCVQAVRIAQSEDAEVKRAGGCRSGKQLSLTGAWEEMEVGSRRDKAGEPGRSQPKRP